MAKDSDARMRRRVQDIEDSLVAAAGMPATPRHNAESLLRMPATRMPPLLVRG
jgi:hypothetical protein